VSRQAGCLAKLVLADGVLAQVSLQGFKLALPRISIRLRSTEDASCRYPVHCQWDKRSESLRAYCVRNTFVALTFTRYLQFHEPLFLPSSRKLMVSRIPVSARRAAGRSEDSPSRSTLFCPASTQKMVMYRSRT
jgi:hypothetical protein